MRSSPGDYVSNVPIEYFDFEPSVLLATKASDLTLQGYCTLNDCDCGELAIDISDLRKLICPADDEHFACARADGDLKRAVIVGFFEGPQIRYYGRADCPAKNELVLRDYDERLMSSSALRRIIKLIGKIAETTVDSFTGFRFSVEFFWRSLPVVQDLPAHEDGVTILFFLVLHNSMVGGDLRIFGLRKAQSPSAMNCPPRNVHFYDQEEAELLLTLPCQPGTGYLIREGLEANSQSVLHGCSGWENPQDGIGARIYMRISFSCG